ncbi:hypothetical protein [Methylorubrum extorquens]|uniref:hypothetical protein n=1 Tax=Methylorubrum extorquens TaxID=408 RepID=UPI0031BB317A
MVRLDFYGAPLRVDAEERLERCVTLLDDYAREVFEAQEENRQGIVLQNSHKTR